MNEKVEQLLQQLADKLGTTVEHLWEILVNQAVIWVIGQCIIIIVSLSILVVCLHFCIKIVKKIDDPEIRDDGRYFTTLLVTGSSVVVFFIIVVVAIIDLMLDGPAAFFNPEYWALKELTGMFK